MQNHHFCWTDLATVDDVGAAAFYEALFGWSSRTCARAAGRFALLEQDGVWHASLYRLARSQVENGVPSHWLPYVSTDDLSVSIARAKILGGDLIVAPQHVPGLASIAVVADPTGALFGLWQSDELSDWRANRAPGAVPGAGEER